MWKYKDENERHLRYILNWPTIMAFLDVLEISFVCLSGSQISGNIVEKKRIIPEWSTVDYSIKHVVSGTHKKRLTENL